MSVPAVTNSPQIPSEISANAEAVIHRKPPVAPTKEERAIAVGHAFRLSAGNPPESRPYSFIGSVEVRGNTLFVNDRQVFKGHKISQEELRGIAEKLQNIESKGDIDFGIRYKEGSVQLIANVSRNGKTKEQEAVTIFEQPFIVDGKFKKPSDMCTLSTGLFKALEIDSENIGSILDLANLKQKFESRINNPELEAQDKQLLKEYVLANAKKRSELQQRLEDRIVSLNRQNLFKCTGGEDLGKLNAGFYALHYACTTLGVFDQERQKTIAKSCCLPYLDNEDKQVLASYEADRSEKAKKDILNLSAYYSKRLGDAIWGTPDRKALQLKMNAFASMAMTLGITQREIELAVDEGGSIKRMDMNDYELLGRKDDAVGTPEKYDDEAIKDALKKGLSESARQMYRELSFGTTGFTHLNDAYALVARYEQSLLDVGGTDKQIETIEKQARASEAELVSNSATGNHLTVALQKDLPENVISILKTTKMKNGETYYDYVKKNVDYFVLANKWNQASGGNSAPLGETAARGVVFLNLEMLDNRSVAKSDIPLLDRDKESVRALFTVESLSTDTFVYKSSITAKDIDALTGLADTKTRAVLEQTCNLSSARFRAIDIAETIVHEAAHCSWAKGHVTLDKEIRRPSTPNEGMAFGIGAQFLKDLMDQHDLGPDKAKVYYSFLSNKTRSDSAAMIIGSQSFTRFDPGVNDLNIYPTKTPLNKSVRIAENLHRNDRLEYLLPKPDDEKKFEAIILKNSDYLEFKNSKLICRGIIPSDLIADLMSCYTKPDDREQVLGLYKQQSDIVYASAIKLSEIITEKNGIKIEDLRGDDCDRIQGLIAKIDPEIGKLDYREAVEKFKVAADQLRSDRGRFSEMNYINILLILQTLKVSECD